MEPARFYVFQFWKGKGGEYGNKKGRAFAIWRPLPEGNTEQKKKEEKLIRAHAMAPRDETDKKVTRLTKPAARVKNLQEYYTYTRRESMPRRARLRQFCDRSDKFTSRCLFPFFFLKKNLGEEWKRSLVIIYMRNLFSFMTFCFRWVLNYFYNGNIGLEWD